MITPEASPNATRHIFSFYDLYKDALCFFFVCVMTIGLCRTRSNMAETEPMRMGSSYQEQGPWSTKPCGSRYENMEQVVSRHSRNNRADDTHEETVSHLTEVGCTLDIKVDGRVDLTV